MPDEGIHGLTIPKLGMTMKEGKVARWLVAEGAAVKAGDPVVDIETEKITSECEAPATGVLRRRVAQEGAVLPVGGLVAVFAAPNVPDPDIDAFVAAFKPEQEV
ncbi:MAG TPA: biotin/lipoyl-containing protein [Burkholderiales bacterium]|nr:biotin/lipoyl-containing protein [Burkholderiales bacterium]